MKYLFLLFLLIPSICSSQFTTIKWYFGYNAGIDFSSDNPKILNDGKIVSNEGVATVCDEFGKLLFYSDGKNVWNRTHQLMDNGTELSGNTSSTNAAYIVPHPHNDNQFYLFTTDESEQQLKNGLCYSIIDISENDGNGKVILKNQTLNAPNTEKILAIPKESVPEYWIITHDWLESDFLVYTLNPYGIKLEKRISSDIFSASDSTDFSLSIGYIKHHRATNKIAMAVFGKGYYLFDFDILSGNISNKSFIDDTSSKGAYGLEFSQSGRFLYTTSFDTLYHISRLHQFDLDNLHNPESSYLITLFSYAAGAIQMGPDNKIYVSTEDNLLSLIEYPDSLTTQCKFKKDVIKLNKNQQVKWGFPRAIPQLQTPKFRIIHNTPICEGDSLLIEANILEGIEYRWNGPDGFTSDSRKIVIPKSKISDFGYYVCEFIFNNELIFKDSIEAKMIHENLYVDDFNTKLGDICRGYELWRKFSIINETEYEIIINKIYLESENEFSIYIDENQIPTTLNEFDDINLKLNFTSEIPGKYSNKLIIEYENACGNGVKEYKLSAQVIDANITIDYTYADFGSICREDTSFINVPIINDSENDIVISEMYFSQNSGFKVQSPVNFIEANSKINSRIAFHNPIPNNYKDTLFIIYDLTCEKGIRAFEFTCNVDPLIIDIDFPEEKYYQGADTCFYVKYTKNCDLPDEFELHFDFYYNTHIFYMQYVLNAAVIDSVHSGDYVYKRLKINNFTSNFSKDTLCKICGNILLSPEVETILTAKNIVPIQYSIIRLDTGKIRTEEVCMQNAMRLAMYTTTNMQINQIENNLQIIVTGDEKGEFELLVVNNLSSVVYENIWQSTGAFEKEMNIADLSSGVYFVILRTPLGFKFMEKVFFIN